MYIVSIHYFGDVSFLASWSYFKGNDKNITEELQHAKHFQSLEDASVSAARLRHYKSYEWSRLDEYPQVVVCANPILLQVKEMVGI